MTKRLDTDDYRTLFLNDLPLLDVRAPVEFVKGAFPCSTNIPLLDDDQRTKIGTRYKEQGQDAAIELGWRLATPEIQQQRIKAWSAYINQHPNGYLYCFRGGLRSRLSQQLIRESGLNYPLIKGGYKAMRRFLIDELDAISRSQPMIAISGRTGSGKTLAIKQLQQAVDLEGLANHRGSAFGRQLQEQPSQINFENALSIALIKLQAAQSKVVFVEDEGPLIGRVSLPQAFLEAFKRAPRILLETPMDKRINITLADYVTEAIPAYRNAYGEAESIPKFREHVLGNLARIRKRLGGDRHSHLHGLFSSAIDELDHSGSTDAFRPGIEMLLKEYYDPMYDYQQAKRRGQVLFKGEHDELIAWAQRYQSGI